MHVVGIRQTSQALLQYFSKNHLLDVLASFQGNDLYELREG